jgi:hypothetical protein
MVPTHNMKELDVNLMERYLENQNIILIALVIIGITPYFYIINIYFLN